MLKRKRNRIIIVVLLLLVAGLYGLYNLDRQHTITLDLTGEYGRKVRGHFIADGVKHQVAGTLPLKVQFTASRTEFAFALTEEQPDKVFGVTILVDGKEWGHCRTTRGIMGAYEHTGVPGWGVTGGAVGGLNSTEIAAITK